MITSPVLANKTHLDWLKQQALSQFRFFAKSVRDSEGFYVLDLDGAPLPDEVQELHTTTRLVHSYTLAKKAGVAGADDVIDQGVKYLLKHHRDAEHGGYCWSVGPEGVVDGTKLAYGHVFVLLAAVAAKSAGHPDADALLADVDTILDTHFWDEEAGRFVDEFNRDWTPFSTYRGMNANMHAIEAMLTAYEVTGTQKYLDRAGRILGFFFDTIAPQYGWRLPEHYTQDWQVDEAYAGDPMFRPKGSTPGHSFELGRLLLQYWDLTGRTDTDAPKKARKIIYQALEDAWDPELGGFVYTLGFDGEPDIYNRYWWPVTEAIGALSALIKLGETSFEAEEDEDWYARCWAFAQQNFIDPRGGWYPEIDDDGRPNDTQFKGKPDIYHSIQATLLPLIPGVSGMYAATEGILND